MRVTQAHLNIRNPSLVKGARALKRKEEDHQVARTRKEKSRSHRRKRITGKRNVFSKMLLKEYIGLPEMMNSSDMKSMKDV